MEDVVIKILPDFTIWKLHSFKEILIFFLVLATGLVVFRWKWLQMKKARTPEMAMKRVKKPSEKVPIKKPISLCPQKAALQASTSLPFFPERRCSLGSSIRATASMVIIRIPHGV